MLSKGEQSFYFIARPLNAYFVREGMVGIDFVFAVARTIENTAKGYVSYSDDECLIVQMVKRNCLILSHVLQLLHTIVAVYLLLSIIPIVQNMNDELRRNQMEKMLKRIHSCT